MKKLVSWLADFFPNTVFYGAAWRTYVEGALREHHGGDRHRWITHGAQTLVVAMGDELEPGQSAEVSFQGLEFQGKTVGDFTVTIERNTK